MMATQQEALLQAIGPDSDHGYGDAGMILTTGLAVLLFVATIWVYSLQH
ncbi:MAG: hypothetical protein U0271_02600 [Polyangiaceae bacterium]